MMAPGSGLASRPESPGANADRAPLELSILGIRGIPASHGGFETFAEHFASYLVAHGWQVNVYCQEPGSGRTEEDEWRGVRRIRIPVRQEGPLGTVVFDWKATLHAARRRSLVLTLGYNTAVFSSLYRLEGVVNLMNMDGLEWKRDKWSLPARIWLYLNERAGCRLAHHLIADHPEIRAHLLTRAPPEKISTIPYGADDVREADAALIAAYGLAPGRYVLVIARPEPENSILEIVEAFARRRRGVHCVLLGGYDFEGNAYHRKVAAAASPEVLFPGAIYDKPTVQALRFFSRIYVHGHSVGGTNPSLVEALGAGSPVLARDNAFNRWVLGDAGLYFSDANELASRFDQMLDDEKRLARMAESSRGQFRARFTWDRVLAQYESLVRAWALQAQKRRPRP